MNPQPLTTRVEMESQLAAKLKASFRVHPERPPQPYYRLLVMPYMDDKYVDKPKDKR